MSKREKDPGIAALLSFLFTGAGQIYNEELTKGFLFMLLQIVNALLMMVVVGFITFPVTWVIGIVDAYKVAERSQED